MTKKNSLVGCDTTYVGTHVLKCKYSEANGITFQKTETSLVISVKI